MDLKKYKKLLSSKSKYVVLIGVVGISLIFISTIKSPKKEPTKEDKIESINYINSEEYLKQLESRLNNIISKIEGVGKVDVFVTMENGIENIYANSEKKATNSNENISGKTSTRDDLQKDIVIIETKDGKKALMIKQREPTIRGVLIVCDGANNPEVVNEITEAVSKPLGVGLSKISVCKRDKKILN